MRLKNTGKRLVEEEREAERHRKEVGFGRKGGLKTQVRGRLRKKWRLKNTGKR